MFEGIYQRSNNRGGESVDDINSTVESEQLAADDALKLASNLPLATLFLLLQESCKSLIQTKTMQVIKLRCMLKESQDARIGFVNNDKVVQPEVRPYTRDGKLFISGTLPTRKD